MDIICRLLSHSGFRSTRICLNNFIRFSTIFRVFYSVGRGVVINVDVAGVIYSLRSFSLARSLSLSHKKKEENFNESSLYRIIFD